MILLLGEVESNVIVNKRHGTHQSYMKNDCKCNDRILVLTGAGTVGAISWSNSFIKTTQSMSNVKYFHFYRPNIS